jgi:hypothetical protein
MSAKQLCCMRKIKRGLRVHARLAIFLAAAFDVNLIKLTAR